MGNFPGVTVDRKDGSIRGKEHTLVTDLPGIYSMSPYSSEEIVTRNFVLNEHPKGIINIVDATNIERNLYLTMQLMELDIPMVLALNMMDEVRENGGSILINRMEEMLGIPVVPISAAKNEGIDELVSHALHVAKYQERPQEIDYCDANEDGGAVHRCLHAIMHLIEDHAREAQIPVRFAASKLAEGDKLILEALHLDQNEKEMLEHIVTQMETERGLDRAAAIAHMRFDFIESVCDETVVKPHESKEHLRSVQIDRILTGKYTAIPCFVGIMGLVFYLTFGVIGAFLSGLLDQGITALGTAVDHWLTAGGASDVIHSLVIDGIFNGVGSVLSFLPIIVTLFFFLSLLEDSGYMARVGAANPSCRTMLNLSNTWLCSLYFVQLRIAKVNPILLLSTCSTWSKLMPVALTWMRALTKSTPSGTSELRSTFSADTLKSGALYVPEPSRSTLVRPATSMCRWLMGAAAAA